VELQSIEPDSTIHSVADCTKIRPGNIPYIIDVFELSIPILFTRGFPLPGRLRGKTYQPSLVESTQVHQYMAEWPSESLLGASCSLWPILRRHISRLFWHTESYLGPPEDCLYIPCNAPRVILPTYRRLHGAMLSTHPLWLSHTS
jgi:hypothetical protein